MSIDLTPSGQLMHLDATKSRFAAKPTDLTANSD